MLRNSKAFSSVYSSGTGSSIVAERVPRYVIGIDEAGRGPLAGPVVVAAVGCERRTSPRIFDGIRDSKQLTSHQRDEWFKRLTAHRAIRWAVTSISPRVIDRINIRQAALMGARRVAKKFAHESSSMFLLDGGLRLSKSHSFETIIKGDEKIPLIAAASIMAKVTRDRMMLRTHRKYPQYRFDLHKGYGTALHRQLIAEFGPSPVHRVTFRLVDRHIELGII